MSPLCLSPAVVVVVVVVVLRHDVRGRRGSRIGGERRATMGCWAAMGAAEGSGWLRGSGRWRLSGLSGWCVGEEVRVEMDRAPGVEGEEEAGRTLLAGGVVSGLCRCVRAACCVTVATDHHK